MSASWARLGRVFSRWRYWMQRDRAPDGRLRVIIVVLMAMIRRLPGRAVLFQLSGYCAFNYRIADYF